MKCWAPWSNLDVKSDGQIRPCCKFETSYYDEEFFLPTNSLDEYLNSTFLSSIKQEFEKNTFPKGCERCVVDEKSGIESKRQLDYIRWKDHYDSYSISDGFITSSIAFGNTCNLSCIMCSPRSSSKWRQEAKDIYGINTPSFQNTITDKFISKFQTCAPNLIHLDIPGGEPFLSQVSKQKDLLRYFIQSNQAKNISIHYTTNAQQYPDQEFWDLWKHFKEIDMQLSIDGVKERYEYIRYPANWDTLVNIVGQFITAEHTVNNLRLSVSHTVSAYNIFYLDEFFNWCEDIGLPKPYTGRTHWPTELRPEVWNGTAVVDKLQSSDRQEVRNWANVIVNNTADLNEFISRTKRHDNYRGKDFYKNFPELNDILKEIYNDN